MEETPAVDAFMSELWGGKQEDGVILVWSGIWDGKGLTGKKPLWAGTPEAAVGNVRAELRQRIPREIYVGVGLRAKMLAAPSRGGVADVIAVAGLWADVDFAGPTRVGGKNYPPDEPAVMKIIESLGLRPTLVINSGYGLQFWWLLKEVLYFNEDARITEDAARLQFAVTSGAWQRLIAARAKQIGGWEVDSTGDLARVLRVAGTANNKGSQPAAVRILDSSGPRYSDMSAFEELIGTQRVAAEQIEAEFTVRADGEPPFEKFAALCDAEPRFKRSWNHERTDLDTSASGYEQSLATWAAMASWTDQEIADLIIAHRKKWQPEKLAKVVERKDYIERTIQRARTLTDRGIKEKDVVQFAVAREGPDVADGEPDTRPKILARLSEFYFGGLRLSRVVKYGKTECDYVFFSDREEAITTNTDDLFANAKMVRKITEATKGRCCPPRKTPVIWDTAVRMILEVSDEVDMPEATERGQVEDWIDTYLERNGATSQDEAIDEAATESRPLLIAGNLYLNSTSFRQFVADVCGERLTPKRLSLLLRKASFDRGVWEFTDTRGERRWRRYWVGPWGASGSPGSGPPPPPRIEPGDGADGAFRTDRPEDRAGGPPARARRADGDSRRASATNAVAGLPEASSNGR